MLAHSSGTIKINESCPFSLNRLKLLADREKNCFRIVPGRLFLNEFTGGMNHMSFNTFNYNQRP
jgi:hypothetical protein